MNINFNFIQSPAQAIACGICYFLWLGMLLGCSPPVVDYQSESKQNPTKPHAPDSSEEVNETEPLASEQPTLALKLPLPEGFVDLGEYIPSMVVELRYYSADNFIGDTVQGYQADRAILSQQAAVALAAVQIEIEGQGLGLKLYDAYRPQRAVDHFMAWARDRADTLSKSSYYPELHKGQLFAQGYVARKSSHTRGAAVDVTLIYLEPDSLGAEVDMGSPWDLFDEVSWGASNEVTPIQSTNRELLRLSMVQHGFLSLPQEWWHFRLNDEPFPDTYFDFEVR
jgi:D-alanyl-D-alanine dipeptidase